MTQPRIAVLGASGLIGGAVARELLRRGSSVLALARKFNAADLAAFGAQARQTPFVDADEEALGRLLAESGAEIIVNAVGVLQDSAAGTTQEAHVGFVRRLVEALRTLGRPVLLVHLSIPGAQVGTTAFSRTKGEAERTIAASGLAHIVLRPGFVVAPAAYGGSALIRALAASPLLLPEAERRRPFQIVALADVIETIASAAEAWAAGRRDFAAMWDVLSPAPTTVGEVVEAFRAHFGGPRSFASLPAPMLDLGAALADAVAALGWRPPIRSTALAEMRRGVTGDPAAWMMESGAKPRTLTQALDAVAPSVQERWFARLFLVKAGVLAALAGFFAVSGAVALTAGFPEAKAHLAAHGVSPGLADGLVVATSLADLGVGALIAVRGTARAGLFAALALSLSYLVSGTVLAPELWIDPLGPFVKIFPALALIAVALAVLDDR